MRLETKHTVQRERNIFIGAIVQLVGSGMYEI